MFRDRVRRWLGVPDIEGSLEDVEIKVGELEHKLDTRAGREEIDSRLKDIREEVRETKIMASGYAYSPSDYTGLERSVLAVMMAGEVTVRDIAEELDKSPATVRKYIGRLREKLELEVEEDGKKKVYSLPEEVVEELGPGVRVEQERKSGE